MSELSATLPIGLGPAQLAGEPPVIAAYVPDLMIIMLGIHDSRQSVSQATFTSNITNLMATCDVILMSVVPSSTSASGPPDSTLQANYASAAV